MFSDTGSLTARAVVLVSFMRGGIFQIATEGD